MTLAVDKLDMKNSAEFFTHGEDFQLEKREVNCNPVDN